MLQVIRDKETGDSGTLSRFSGVLQVIEIKRLEVIVAEARSEVSKAEEQLEELARHATFLDSITPAHHFQVTFLAHSLNEPRIFVHSIFSIAKV